MTFEELVAKSLDEAGKAEDLLGRAGDAPPLGLDVDEAHVHALLAEMYARLASAIIVNRTSMHAALEAARGPRPS